MRPVDRDGGQHMAAGLDVGLLDPLTLLPDVHPHRPGLRRRIVVLVTVAATGIAALVTAADDPQTAVPFDLRLPNGKVLPKPGNLAGSR